MSASIHLAKPEDFDRLSALVAAFHEEEGLPSTPEKREQSIAPLLAGNPYGAAYLIGLSRAPIGYVIVTFGWSVEFGGMDCFIDEIFLRPAVRGRGIATEVLTALPKTLASAGVKAVHLEVDRENASAQKLYARTGFKSRDRYMLMSKVI